MNLNEESESEGKKKKLLSNKRKTNVSSSGENDDPLNDKKLNDSIKPCHR